MAINPVATFTFPAAPVGEAEGTGLEVAVVATVPVVLVPVVVGRPVVDAPDIVAMMLEAREAANETDEEAEDDAEEVGDETEEEAGDADEAAPPPERQEELVE